MTDATPGAKMPGTTMPGTTAQSTGSGASTSRPTAEQPWPVRVVSQKIGGWVARLGWIWVDGQVAQITRRPGSTVVFITLRDPSADLSLSVTTNRDVLDLGAPGLTDGARIVVHAKPDFHPARGTLSLRADEVRMVGLGELLARLEQVKKLLAAEGLFDPRRKRSLPFLPGRIGLVTGRASAAERDVRMNTSRRWPGIDFRVINVAVQGAQAVPQMIDAIAVLDNDPTIEVIVLARGGGSTEDLLPFSDEALCRAVFACRTPIVSAIGHETDTPLVDYVADVRASTPTDVAKRIVPDLRDEIRLIGQARARMWRTVTGRLETESAQLDALRSRPVLARPDVIIDDRASDVSLLATRGERAFGHRLDGADRDLVHTIARLRALSPKATLDRGYAIVQHADDDRLVRDAGAVAPGERLRVRVATGEFGAVVADKAAPKTDAGAPETDATESPAETTEPETDASAKHGRRAATPNGHSPAKVSRPNASRSRR